MESKEPVALSEDLPLVTMDEEDESLSKIVDQAEDLSGFALHRQWKAKYEDDKNSGKFALRSSQAVIHLSYTEIRLSELERKLGELQEKIEEGRNDYKATNKQEMCPVHMPVLRWEPVDALQILGHKDPIPPSQLPAIEVLYSRSETGTTCPVSGTQNEMKANPAGGRLNSNESEFLKVPQRLRIRSWPLLAQLENACRENFGLYNVLGDFPAPIILLRPFKVLFLFEREIRDSLLDVKKKVEAIEKNEIEEVEDISHGPLRGYRFHWRNLLQDLKLLIGLMDTELLPTYNLRQSIKDLTLKEIEYDDLWHLFHLGDTIVKKDGEHLAFKVIGIAGGRDPLYTRNPPGLPNEPVSHFGFVLDCLSLRYDGTHYTPQLHNFHIPKFTGYRQIWSLEVYPINFNPNAEKLKSQLISNGRKYLELTRRQYSHKMFCGRTVDESPEDIEGQIIIDIAMALNAEPDWRPSSAIGLEQLTKPDQRECFFLPPCKHGEIRPEGCCGGDIVFRDQKLRIGERDPFWKDFPVISRPRTEQQLGDDLILLPNTVHGFVLRLRKWVTVRIDDLLPVTFDNDFDNLMMDENYKQAILALVETHEKSTASTGAQRHSIGTSLDLVKGKGTGLIMLLHGEPGVGKTSTAECVADRTKRPLFPITCGDIGETAIEVEQKLQQNFRLAHRWGSVLLLDEADVFLAKRNKTDLRRNAVTSVFLRSLDYYAGILFLTTNRVGGIDPAFKSRIHLSVFYPRLDLERTQKLFEVFIDKAKKELNRSGSANFQIKSKEILRFARKNYQSLEKQGINTWNGRQIRNAFQTAIALVEYDTAHMRAGDLTKPVLGKKQFEVVAEGSRQFDIYLMRTLQGVDADIAMRDQWRDDTFDLEDFSVPRPPKMSLSSRKRGKKPITTEDLPSVTESDSGTESESDMCSIEEDEVSATPVSTSNKSKRDKSESTSGHDMDEYQEFLKFQAMKKAMSK